MKLENQWKTAGYTEWLKKQRQRHSREMFMRYLNKKLDLAFVSSGKENIKELFWQVENLRIAVVYLIQELIHIGDQNEKVPTKKRNKIKSH